MQRRDFIRLAGAASLSVLAPPAMAVPSKDSIFRPSSLYDGPFFVLVNAGGGWDPTSLCDPKGTLDSEEGNANSNPMNRSYLARDIPTAADAPIPYAPVGGSAAFFEKYASKLVDSPTSSALK